jgi:hypothetical protein
VDGRISHYALIKDESSKGVSPITNKKNKKTTPQGEHLEGDEAQAAPSTGMPLSPSQRARYMSFFLLALTAPCQILALSTYGQIR